MRALRVERFSILLSLFCLLLIHSNVAQAGLYSQSAHGESSNYGVDRTDLSGIYQRGNCAHCHEQHTSIGGDEPDPQSGAPNDYLAFGTNHTSQSSNFCYNCHGNGTTYQSDGPVVNRTYSYRAGNYTLDTISSIKESFETVSAHNLDDILTFVTGRWGYTSDSNPCTACHNPHAAQGDPIGNGNLAKSNLTRGYPLSRPSQHNGQWGLWGDEANETMSSYATTNGQRYQAPYRYTSTVVFEPDGSSTQDGSNVTDMVSFCTDCHDNSNTISSTPLSRNLYQITWSGANAEMHGQGAATDVAGGELQSPYSDTFLGDYVLNCTDCHEPHGSEDSDGYLLRKEINGNNTPGRAMCHWCHRNSQGAHHAIDGAGCGSNWNCHYFGWDPEISAVTTIYRCFDCHFHGNSTIYKTDGSGTPTGTEPWDHPLF